MRPLFPKGFRDEVQIQVMVLSTDTENDPDVIGVVAAAAAVCVAPIPFDGPIAAVRVGRVDGRFVLYPTVSQLARSDLDLVVAGHRDAVNMIEVGAREIREQDLADAIEFGHQHAVLPICEMLEELRAHAGRPASWQPSDEGGELVGELRARIWDDLRAAKRIPGKQERKAAVDALYERVLAEYCPPDAAQPRWTPEQVKAALYEIERALVREQILTEGLRPDGRGLDDLRPITCEVGWLPRTHGSALFQRGETQAMVTTTLGTASDEQIVDELLQEYSKKFMLHYNFPPFSVGEVRRIGPPGRREIGHGALAERSLEPVMPSPDEFPYTIRVVSDILESNGSSSMATVCGGSLSLMDAGVPIRAQVAGISIGLVQEGERSALLTDIIGEEDAFGDMDFKVAGTRQGITGVQLDIKTRGLSYALIRAALERARDVRHRILDIMEQIDRPRRGRTISEYAPRHRAR
ncbi:MAG: hypothetical protein KatS3mg103_0703 [Phycisphaerales bacterium]|nr:MAG: hypothetical protein KatS3mg103_0703 [Phycisphaerales bacterium]